MVKMIAELKKKSRYDLIKKVEQADYDDSLEEIKKAGSAPLIKLLDQLYQDTKDLKDSSFPDFCKTVYKISRTLPIFRNSLSSYKKNVAQSLQVAEKGLEDAVKALKNMEHNLAIELSDQLSTKNRSSDQDIFTYSLERNGL